MRGVRVWLTRDSRNDGTAGMYRLWRGVKRPRIMWPAGGDLTWGPRHPTRGIGSFSPYDAEGAFGVTLEPGECTRITLTAEQS